MIVHEHNAPRAFQDIHDHSLMEISRRLEISITVMPTVPRTSIPKIESRLSGEIPDIEHMKIAKRHAAIVDAGTKFVMT